ncbi:MAG: hypothetical protein LBI05_00885 [Planctomycetaceae bacterium]|jgi:hypothetical protein|nr:hypothetical protein [Planctomycetaceae bacterium]
MSKRLSPFYTDQKTAEAILAVARNHLARPADGCAASLLAAGVTSQYQNTCQFKLRTDWKEISASNFVVSGNKIVTLDVGAEERSYPTTIYAYGARPQAGKDSIIVATRRANRWVLLPTSGGTTIQALVMEAIPATPSDWDYSTDALPPHGKIKIYGRTYTKADDYDLCAADFLARINNEVIPVPETIGVHGPYVSTTLDDNGKPKIYYVAKQNEGIFQATTKSAITGPTAVTSVDIKNGDGVATFTNIQFPLLTSTQTLPTNSPVWIRRDWGTQGVRLYIVRARCV